MIHRAPALHPFPLWTPNPFIHAVTLPRCTAFQPNTYENLEIWTVSRELWQNHTGRDGSTGRERKSSPHSQRLLLPLSTSEVRLLWTPILQGRTYRKPNTSISHFLFHLFFPSNTTRPGSGPKSHQRIEVSPPRSRKAPPAPQPRSIGKGDP